MRTEVSPTSATPWRELSPGDQSAVEGWLPSYVSSGRQHVRNRPSTSHWPELGRTLNTTPRSVLECDLVDSSLAQAVSGHEALGNGITTRSVKGESKCAENPECATPIVDRKGASRWRMTVARRLDPMRCLCGRTRRQYLWFVHLVGVLVVRSFRLPAPGARFGRVGCGRLIAQLLVEG